MPIARLLSRSHIAIGLAYVAGYVLLDWVSYVHPFGAFGITPWNPQAGLSFALILLFGIEFVPWLFVAPFLADVIVRHMPLPVTVELVVVLVTGVGYGAATVLLLSRRIGFDPTLASKHSLLWLVGVALVSMAFVAFGHIVVLVMSGMAARVDFVEAFLYAFIGDLIGVVVVTPFLLILFTRQRFPDPSWEMGLLVLFALFALWVVFGFTESFRFQLFYILFIPIVWTAIRFGLEGVTAGLVMIQIGLIVAVQMSAQSSIDVVSYQALMVVLAATGLAIGVVVNEQFRAQQQLRLQHEALNRASRLGTMGEFAAAVAHEINQPLTAIANYARLAKRAAESIPPDSSSAISAATQAIEQVDRAANVVRRLREFIRGGYNEIAPVPVADLVADTHSFCRPELEKYKIDFDAKIARDLPNVMVDSLQIEQVLVNLVRNSVEALAQAGRRDGVVTIEASQEGNGWVSVCVRDNGPGFEPNLAGQPITPFTTTKDDGLGLGLSLSKSIVEAHGGRLQINGGAHGVAVTFTLPITSGEEKTA
jgi:signal transduction histidine kinase